MLVITEEYVKLGDFGFSTQVTGPLHYLNTFCGSPPYASPELFNDDHYIGEPVDIWALGVLLFFILIGNMPFSAPTVPQLRSSILKGEYRIPGHFTPNCVRLIRKFFLFDISMFTTLIEIYLQSTSYSTTHRNGQPSIKFFGANGCSNSQNDHNLHYMKLEVSSRREKKPRFGARNHIKHRHYRQLNHHLNRQNPSSVTQKNTTMFLLTSSRTL